MLAHGFCNKKIWAHCMSLAHCPSIIQRRYSMAGKGHAVGPFNPFSHEFGFCTRSAFSSNSPARMRHSVQIDKPLSSRARALWRSFFLPFYRPTHSLCACLSACSDIYDMSHSIRTLLLFFFSFLFLSIERVDERNIKAPTDTSKRRPTTSEDAWVVFMR